MGTVGVSENEFRSRCFDLHGKLKEEDDRLVCEIPVDEKTRVLAIYIRSEQSFAVDIKGSKGVQKLMRILGKLTGGS